MADTKAYRGWKRWKLCQTDQLSYNQTTTAGRNSTREETSIWRQSDNMVSHIIRHGDSNDHTIKSGK